VQSYQVDELKTCGMTGKMFVGVEDVFHEYFPVHFAKFMPLFRLPRTYISKSENLPYDPAKILQGEGSRNKSLGMTQLVSKQNRLGNESRDRLMLY
jgi:hypothetical protein